MLNSACSNFNFDQSETDECREHGNPGFEGVSTLIRHRKGFEIIGTQLKNLNIKICLLRGWGE